METLQADMEAVSFDQARETCQRTVANIQSVIRGQEPSIRKLMAVLAGGGHALIEDFPGSGKTTLAKALARSIDVDFKRVQFTPDLLPSDILGVSIFNQKDQEFHFHKGAIFANILLADEINRASPRTQSAFFVVATQNPVESRGTYPLPEAQMDRFALRFKMGYVAPDEEVDILTAQTHAHPLDALKPVVNKEDVLALRKTVAHVRVSDELKRYVVDLCGATRNAAGVKLGASPRASIALMKAAQALALFDGLEFVTPDQIREIASDVIAHRVMIDPQARFSGRTAEEVVNDLLNSVPVPA
jgi:MoxR-like ATPase